MTNRVCFGVRSGTTSGLFVSKPGYNVLTCADENLLLNFDRKSAQVLYDTQVTWNAVSWANNSSGSGIYYTRRAVTHPSFGFIPYIHVEVISTSPVQYSMGYLLIPGVETTPFDQTVTGFWLNWQNYASADNGTYVTQFSTYTVTFRVRLLNVENPAVVSWPSSYTPVVNK